MSSGRGEGPPPAQNDSTSVGEELSFLYALASAPCFRQSSLLGIGGGAAIGAMQLARSKDVMRGAETMVKTGCGIALLSWFICRRKYYVEREATYQAMEEMKQKQAAMAAARARKLREEAAKQSSERQQ